MLEGTENTTETGTSPAAAEPTTEGGKTEPGTHDHVEEKETPPQDDAPKGDDDKEGGDDQEQSGSEDPDKTEQEGSKSDPSDDLPDDPEQIRQWLEQKVGVGSPDPDAKPDNAAAAKPFKEAYEDFAAKAEELWSQYDSGYRDENDNPIPNPFEKLLVESLAPIFEVAESIRIQSERNAEREIMDSAAQLLSASKSASKRLAEEYGLSISTLQVAKDVERTAQAYAAAKGLKLEDLATDVETVLSIVKMANYEKLEEALRRPKAKAIPASPSRGKGGSEPAPVADGTSFAQQFAQVRKGR